MAEVLITMGVIGAVAALTLPTITSNIWTSQLTKRATIESRKFTQAIENMVAFDDIAGKGSTDKFIETLRNYLKISKVCDEGHIAECWPTDSFITLDGDGFDLNLDGHDKTYFWPKNSDFTIIDQSGYKGITGKGINFDESRSIVTDSGTSFLLTYNKACYKYDKNAEVNCVMGLFDSNGAKGPNKLGKDVVLLNAQYFGYGFEPEFVASGIKCVGNRGCFPYKFEALAYNQDQENNYDDDPEAAGNVNTKLLNWDDDYGEYDSDNSYDDWD